jgi:hypothetical protein
MGSNFRWVCKSAGCGSTHNHEIAHHSVAVAKLRYSTARRSPNQIVLVLLLVLVLDCPIPDYENEDERFAWPATIWTDTDRVQLCATSAALESV